MSKSFLFKTSKCSHGIVMPFFGRKVAGPGISQR